MECHKYHDKYWDILTLTKVNIVEIIEHNCVPCLWFSKTHPATNTWVGLQEVQSTKSVSV